MHGHQQGPPLPDAKAERDWLAARLIARPRWHVPVGRRVCSEHPERPAQDRCDHCGQPFCAECLQNVGRWRVCRPCLNRLARQRAGPSLGKRLRALWSPLLAALVFGALLAGGVLAIDRGTARTATSANLGGTADQFACLQHYPDPAKLYVVGGLPLYGYPPAHLVLRNCHVQPDEAVLVQGGISGYDVHGQRLAAHLGPVTAWGGADGVLTVTVAIPDPHRFEGSYSIRLAASGHEGSAASASLSAEGHLP